MGVLLAITALLSWGLGDFLIQRSARKFGDWVALFYISAFGTIVLLPFVYHEIPSALGSHALLLWAASIITLFAALLDFEALRVGKISVVEPIYAFEISVTTILAATLIGEGLNILQASLIVSLIVGILLISTRSFSAFKKMHLEKGVWYALLATIGMGTITFLFGLAARETSPLMINWFTSVVLAVACFAYLAYKGRLREIRNDFRASRRLILNVSFFDNLAWVAFSYAALSMPIAIAAGITEGFIVFASGLGLLFNKEKLRAHQWVGFALAVVSVITLAFITGG